MYAIVSSAAQGENICASENSRTQKYGKTLLSPFRLFSREADLLFNDFLFLNVTSYETENWLILVAVANVRLGIQTTPQLPHT